MEETSKLALVKQDIGTERMPFKIIVFKEKRKKATKGLQNTTNIILYITRNNVLYQTIFVTLSFTSKMPLPFRGLEVPQNLTIQGLDFASSSPSVHAVMREAY